MIAEGAAILDIGAESTRPGASPVDAREELQRLQDILPQVAALGCPVSIDSMKATVAEWALENGAALVNDVWGLQRDADMARVVAAHGAPVVIMHNRERADPSIDIIADIKAFFSRSLDIAARAGIPDRHIVLDPGIGFGKTPEQSIRVVAGLTEFAIVRPAAVGWRIAQAFHRSRVARATAAAARRLARRAPARRTTGREHHPRARRCRNRAGAPRRARHRDPAMSDTIFVTGVVIHARHGVMEHETEVGQRFVIDLELGADLSESSRTDRLADTVSYSNVVATATAAFKDVNYRLLERAAGAVADAVLDAFPRVLSVKVTVHKPHAPIAAIFEDVGVVLTRTRAARA